MNVDLWNCYHDIDGIRSEIYEVGGVIRAMRMMNRVDIDMLRSVLERLRGLRERLSGIRIASSRLSDRGGGTAKRLIIELGLC